jgi:hypothetical protein
MEKIIYDGERDGFLGRMEMTYVKHTLFQISNLEARSVIEDIAKREEKNGVSAVEWYKGSPVLLDDIEYNASLVTIGHDSDVEPNVKEDEAVLNALKEVPQAKPGEKGFGVRIDVISPFVCKNFLHYFLK